MRLKIKVKVLTGGCMPSISEKGDWIDLRSTETVELSASQANTLKRIPVYYIPLGVAIKLPKGFEAIIASRSSAPDKLKVFIPNGEGIVDNSYCGNADEWHYICSPMENTTINYGDRICQFRIQLSQKATMWQKLKWLLSSGVELVEVDDLGEENRGGLGSTGVK